VSARRQRRANDSAKVLRVFDTVEKHQKAAPRGVSGNRLEDVLQAGGFSRGFQGDNALVAARAGETIHLRAVFEAHRNPAAARGLNQLFDTFAVTPAGDDDAVECAARFEGLAHGVNSGQPAHFI
jgi:hypothetical protein